jgi:hypothetical protein
MAENDMKIGVGMKGLNVASPIEIRKGADVDTQLGVRNNCNDGIDVSPQIALRDSFTEGANADQQINTRNSENKDK